MSTSVVSDSESFLNSRGSLFYKNKFDERALNSMGTIFQLNSDSNTKLINKMTDEGWFIVTRCLLILFRINAINTYKVIKRTKLMNKVFFVNDDDDEEDDDDDDVGGDDTLMIMM